MHDVSFEPQSSEEVTGTAVLVCGCAELLPQLRALPGGFLARTPVLPGTVMSPEVLCAVVHRITE